MKITHTFTTKCLRLHSIDGPYQPDEIKEIDGGRYTVVNRSLPVEQTPLGEHTDFESARKAAEDHAGQALSWFFHDYDRLFWMAEYLVPDTNDMDIIQYTVTLRTSVILEEAHDGVPA